MSAVSHTRKFIKNLVYHDEENRDRLRLIVIYTIDSRILDILNDIKTEIEGIPVDVVEVGELKAQ